MYICPFFSEFEISGMKCFSHFINLCSLSMSLQSVGKKKHRGSDAGTVYSRSLILAKKSSASCNVDV